MGETRENTNTDGGDLLKDVRRAEASAVDESARQRLLEDDGLTPDGNHPDAEFYFENELDPMRLLPFTGNPYLDKVERVRAEVQRAAVEGREPDLDNPPPTAGTPLKSFAHLNNPMNANVAAGLTKAEPVVVVDELVPEDDDELTAELEAARNDPNYATPKAGDEDDRDEPTDTDSGSPSDSSTTGVVGSGSRSPGSSVDSDKKEPAPVGKKSKK